MNLLSKLEFVNTVTRCSDVVLRMFGANTRAVDNISTMRFGELDELRTGCTHPDSAASSLSCWPHHPAQIAGRS